MIGRTFGIVVVLYAVAYAVTWTGTDHTCTRVGGTAVVAWDLSRSCRFTDHTASAWVFER